MTSRGLLVALLCVVASAAIAASTTIYKWTDADGTVHLSSSKPPAGVKYETRTVASSNSPPPAASRSGATSSELVSRLGLSEVEASLLARLHGGPAGGPPHAQA